MYTATITTPPYYRTMDGADHSMPYPQVSLGETVVVLGGADSCGNVQVVNDTGCMEQVHQGCLTRVSSPLRRSIMAQAVTVRSNMLAWYSTALNAALNDQACRQCGAYLPTPDAACGRCRWRGITGPVGK